MKNIFLTAGIVIMAATATFAYNSTDRNYAKNERKEGNKAPRRKHKMENNYLVSGFTKIQFGKDFPGATNVEFVNTKNFDEVYFISGKRILKAYYDYNYNLLGTTEKKSFTDLPENAQKKILEKYAGFTIADVVKFDDNESNDTDMILYGTSFDDKDNYFVELENAGKATVVQVDLEGRVSFFTNME